MQIPFKSSQLWRKQQLDFTIKQSNLYVHAKMYMQNIKHRAKKEKKMQGIKLQLYKKLNASFVVGEDDAVTYLHYILPALPDHNCEKDALVRRQRGPEGSYPSLSGRWGDQVDWAQIVLAHYFIVF